MSLWGMKLTGYEGTGVCWLCGSEVRLRGGKPVTFCKTECRNLYFKLFSWREASGWALQRARYKCQQCGMSAAGMRALAHAKGHHLDYHLCLEVHHKVPLLGSDYNWTLLNLPMNLMVLCLDCHNLTKRKAPAIPELVIVRPAGQLAMAI